jgi:hypothetical protein
MKPLSLLPTSAFSFHPGDDARRRSTGERVHVLAVCTAKGDPKPYYVSRDPEHAQQERVRASDLEPLAAARGPGTILTIVLPNGDDVRLRAYVGAWRALLDMPSEIRAGRTFLGWSHFAEDGEVILREMRRGMDERINRHVPGYGVGKKWGSDYFHACLRDATRLNSRTVIHRFETEAARLRFPDREMYPGNVNPGRLLARDLRRIRAAVEAAKPIGKMIAGLALAAMLFTGCASPAEPCTLRNATWVDTLATWPTGQPAALSFGCGAEPRRIAP